MAAGHCKLTGKFGTFVKAHIIPEALYEPDGQTMVISSNPDERPARAPIGAYDKALLTRAGEDLLQKLDDYGVRFLRRKVGSWTPLHDDDDGHLLGHAITNLDLHCLKLFFLSVLWRASASTRKEFRNFTLGPQEDQLKAMILDGDVGEPSDFPIVVMTLEGEVGLVPIMMPFRQEIDGTEFVSAHYGDARVMVGIGECPPTIEKIALPKDGPWLVLATLWNSSDDRKLVRTVFREAISAHGDLWTRRFEKPF